MRKLITVTREHIRLGVPENFYSCPVALALNDAGFDDVEVGGIILDVGSTRIKAPRSVQRFIVKFDRKEQVKPFRFFLNVA